MDTYFNVEWDKCVKCYKCIELCTETYKKYGYLGIIHLSEYGGYPENFEDNPRCNYCEAIIDGKKTPYACNKICEHNAMNITRS